jgi:hypothetical protein
MLGCCAPYVLPYPKFLNLCHLRLSTHTPFPTTPSTQVFNVVSLSPLSSSTVNSHSIPDHTLHTSICHCIFVVFVVDDCQLTLHSQPHPPHKYLLSYLCHLCRRGLSTHTPFPTTPSTQVFVVVSLSSSLLSTFPSSLSYLCHHIFHHSLTSYLCHLHCCQPSTACCHIFIIISSTDVVSSTV